jgi:hypothetical protein
MLKIYKIVEYKGKSLSDNDKCSYVVAENELEAEIIYKKYTGNEDLLYIKELRNNELINHYIIDYNESMPDEDEMEELGLSEDDYLNGYLITENFQEYLLKQTTSHFFCTDYEN